MSEGSELKPHERQLLLLLAQGASNDEIAAAMQLDVGVVERAVTNFRAVFKVIKAGMLANLTQEERHAATARPMLALHILDKVLTDEERRVWKVEAAAAHERLDARCLVTSRAEVLIRRLIVPAGFGMTYAELALHVGLSGRRAVADILDPITKALGDSRIRMQITYHLLWHRQDITI